MASINGPQSNAFEPFSRAFAEIVPIVKETADQLGIQCFDLYAETQSHPEWFADGVHPNADGNRAIADFIHRSIMG